MSENTWLKVIFHPSMKATETEEWVKENEKKVQDEKKEEGRMMEGKNTRENNCVIECHFPPHTEVNESLRLNKRMQKKKRCKINKREEGRIWKGKTVVKNTWLKVVSHHNGGSRSVRIKVRVLKRETNKKKVQRGREGEHGWRTGALKRTDWRSFFLLLLNEARTEACEWREETKRERKCHKKGGGWLTGEHPRKEKQNWNKKKQMIEGHSPPCSEREQRRENELRIWRAKGNNERKKKACSCVTSIKPANDFKATGE